MAMLLKANGESRQLTPEELTLENFWKLIDGFVERLPGTVGEGGVLYINDEARITGLPFNSDASNIAGMTILGDVIWLSENEELLIK